MMFSALTSNGNNGSKKIFSAVLFDMDGVLASVGIFIIISNTIIIVIVNLYLGNSYRQAIIQTGEHFGVKISHEDITIEKKRGNCNIFVIIVISIIIPTPIKGMLIMTGFYRSD